MGQAFQPAMFRVFDEPHIQESHIMDRMDRDEKTRGGPGFSRREFLRGSGAAVAATAITQAAEESIAQETQGRKNVAPAEPRKLTLKVNGEERQLTLEPRVTLLDALRNDLNLTGCKDVCDRTTCGACTVLIDGKPVYACARLAIEVQGKDIQTVESLTKGDKTDPVVTAFHKHDAMQCGFCTPGFVMAVRGFCNMHPNAKLEDVQKGLGGNICRCGTYHGVTQAALECARKGGA